MNTSPSPWSPFRHPTFTIIWTTALISNIGTWMHAIGAGWLMTSLDASALMVSLVYAASTLPMFLLAIPAGALSDIMDRRVMLIWTNVIMMVLAFVFAALVYSGHVNGATLLLFTFLLGAGAALMAPAWQAILPQLVPEEDLSPAVALNGVSINVSRAIGPALAGLLITSFGMGMPFMINAITFLFIIVAIWFWKPPPQEQASQLPSEHLLRAMRVGVRHARSNPLLKNTMWHVAGFMFFANAFWGLLPLLSKDVLEGDASLYGVLLGAVGLGGIVCAFLLPWLNARFTSNRLIVLGTLMTSAVTVFFCLSTNSTLATIASLLFGIGWMLVLTVLNVAAQVALPNWVKARGMAVYLMVFFGGMTVGSIFWGWVAEQTTLETAMLLAGIGGALFLVFAPLWKIEQSTDIDHTPSLHWPAPVTHRDMDHDRGPVMTVLTYVIDAAQREFFLKALYNLKSMRQRDGAYQWGVMEHIQTPNVYLEYFMDDSWTEHLRHHERVSEADKQLQATVRAFHIQGESPEVVHYIAPQGTKGVKL